jgi:hypothetical protein
VVDPRIIRLMYLKDGVIMVITVTVISPLRHYVFELALAMARAHG